MIKRILFYFFILFLIHILPSWNYQFESCCLNEKTTTNNNTTRLLLCPLNHIIKLRSVVFYTGNGCTRSACQKRLNKYYLPCNNRHTCSISIQCIPMDLSACPWLKQKKGYSQYLIIDYNCINEITFNNNKTNKNVVLFSAKVNIESPLDSYNNSILTDNEQEWKEYFLKKYLHHQQFNGEKTIIIHQQRSLLSDIIRTVIILIVFALILILLILIGRFLYKRITLMKREKSHKQSKHQPFPTDEAYDNLKGARMETASDTGTTTDV